MEVILLLAIIVGVPIVVVGGVQVLIWKLVSAKALRIVSAIIALVCGFYLLDGLFAPPVYGNKSGYVGLGYAAIAILMAESLLIILVPLLRRYLLWDKKVEARWADSQTN